jgi:hypothetical protein
MHETVQYLQLWHAIENTGPSNDPDRLIWKWNASDIYSAESCYQAMFHVSTASSSWKLTRKTWAPPRMKFFCWLASLDRRAIGMPWSSAPPQVLVMRSTTRDYAPSCHRLPLLAASMA